MFLFVLQSQIDQPANGFGAGLFIIKRIGGMMDNAHLVGFSVPHPDIRDRLLPHRCHPVPVVLRSAEEISRYNANLVQIEAILDEECAKFTAWTRAQGAAAAAGVMQAGDNGMTVGQALRSANYIYVALAALVILATFAVIAAVLPMAFVGGLMGPYMRPIPIGAGAAMFWSLAIAFDDDPEFAFWNFRAKLPSPSIVPLRMTMATPTQKIMNPGLGARRRAQRDLEHGQPAGRRALRKRPDAIVPRRRNPRQSGCLRSLRL